MDNELKSVLQEIVNLSDEEKLTLAAKAINSLAPEIAKLFDSKKASIMIVSIFATSVAADGKLTSDEYAMVQSFLSVAGIEMNNDELFEMLRELSGSEAYKAVLSLSKILSEEGQANLVTLVASICAIDDRIDSAEIAFISDLYNV